MLRPACGGAAPAAAAAAVAAAAAAAPADGWRVGGQQMPAVWRAAADVGRRAEAGRRSTCTWTLMAQRTANGTPAEGGCATRVHSVDLRTGVRADCGRWVVWPQLNQPWAAAGRCEKFGAQVRPQQPRWRVSAGM